MNAVKPNGDEEQAEELALAKREILKLRADMRRLEEERDILKKAAVGSTDQRNTVLQFIRRGLISQRFSWPLVKSSNYLV